MQVIELRALFVHGPIKLLIVKPIHSLKIADSLVHHLSICTSDWKLFQKIHDLQLLANYKNEKL
jgi:hypothetical protein